MRPFRWAATFVLSASLGWSAAFAGPAYPERDPFDAITAPRAMAEVRAFLAERSEIRMWIEGGPGFGHQAAAIRAIRRLRELGFRGTVHVVFDDGAIHYESVLSRLNAMIPGLELGPHDVDKGFRSQDLGRLRFTPFSSAYRLQQAQFGLGAAQDAHGGDALGTILHVETLLLLQPRWWDPIRDAADRPRSERALYLPNGERISLQHLLDFGPALRRPDIRDWRLFAVRELAGDPNSAFIANLGERFDDIDVLPTYALDDPSVLPSNLTSAIATRPLIAALRVARAQQPNAWTKPIMIVDFSRHNSFGQLDELKAQLRAVNVPYLEASDPRALNALLAPRRADTIIFVHVGPTPPRAMEEAFLRAPLPGICEGKNLTDVLLSAGKPFLHALRRSGEVERELDAIGASGPAADLIRAAFARAPEHENEIREVRIAPMARYLTAARDPHGPVAQLFAQMSAGDEVRAFNHDLIARGILEAAAALRRLNEPALACPAFSAAR